MTAVIRELGKGASAAVKTPDQVYRAYLDRHELVSGGLVSPNWTEDGGFWFVQGAPENTVILRVNLSTGETVPMFDVAAVRTALAAATGREPPYRGLPFDSFTPAKQGRVEFCYDGARWRLDPASDKLERIGALGFHAQLGQGASERERLTPRTWKRSIYIVGTWDAPEQPSPDGEWLAGIRNHNIVLRSTRDDRDQALTTCGTRDCFWDIETRHNRVLPGAKSGFGSEVSPWSPDSLTLLAYRRDIAGVFRMPRVNWLKPFEEVEYVPYQKAGAKLDRIEPVFVDVRSGRQVPVALETVEDRYIQLLGWHPNGFETLIIVYTRDFRRVAIVAANRETGAVRPLMAESAATSVKIQLSEAWCAAHGFRLLPNGSGFLWLSTRDGWNHLYRYDMNGQLMGQLTSGNWPVYDVTHIGADDFVYFTAAIDTVRPYDEHVCRVPLSGGKVEQLTHQKGIHSPSFAPGGQAFLNTHSAVDRACRTDLLRADGTLLRVISEMDISRLEAVGYRPAEEFTVKAADGTTDLWGVIYKPYDFDASQSYPVIEYIYGGPQVIYAQRFFAINAVKYLNLPWALAQLGYIVVCLDARGTPGRSKAFQDVVHGNFSAGIPDHVGAIHQLCARHPWMDADRVGITGHSWGGYFSTCALLQAPDTYHAAVSSAPGLDPWDFILYEPYLDLPQRNRAAYDNADLIRQAAGIKRPLMLVVGTSDHYNINQTMKMTRALIEARIDHECVVIPQAAHIFAGVENDYFLLKLTGWFEHHVKNRRPRKNEGEQL